ncbi:ribokinase [Nakamurella sp. YIM 132087]|uniref:Ribokinase n=1 Tax=Nakamurella alba TaxID=2665158 RepID=A0A7K1FQP1_9ACTN|nr:carbohydrate kinase family protein [Nakamurella alba]MTD16472.1 ribokinase [Nakamurella alba]
MNDPAPAAPTRPHVTVVGDVGLDVVTKLAGAIVFGHDTRAQVSVAPGGAGGNTAAWLARHDLDVSLIARVGADEAGRTARAELTAAGIDCLFAEDPVLATCCVVVLVAEDGDRTMLADRGANKAFSEADVVLPDIDLSTRRAHLHLSGYVLLDEGSRAAGLASLAAARAAGWTTSLDPQAATHIGTVGAATFLEWAHGVDLLLPNDAELAALGGVEMVLQHLKALVVTHGRHGASWYSADQRATVPAPQVHETDSTGAGDAFNAGLLASWLAGADPVDALRAGVLAGTAAAAAIGARPQDG